MDAAAIILERPGALAVQRVGLVPVQGGDVVVDIAWSGISAGTERLLWSGRMPHFPGLGYPLIPGYESVGRIVDAGPIAAARIDEWVFVPGANCYSDARALFGGAASRIILPSARAIPIPESLGVDGVLCALAATAWHALAGHRLPELIVGHGVLGRLLARLVVALGGPPPTVWERDRARQEVPTTYAVLDAADDPRTDYRTICDVSGDGAMIDPLIARLAKGGELVLAGFYAEPVSFAFPAAFMRETRLRVAAEWQPDDMAAVRALIESGALDLSGLVTDIAPVTDAARAYAHAFEDATCLKMVLDWSAL
jgi:bacteriochlorophyllide a dehydrogenase